MAKGRNVGGWAFLIGVIVAVLIGLFGSLGIFAVGLLVILGLIVGLFNVQEKETSGYLLAATSLVIVSYFGKNVLDAIVILGRVLDAITALVVPSVVVVALKSVYAAAKS